MYIVIYIQQPLSNGSCEFSDYKYCVALYTQHNEIKMDKTEGFLIMYETLNPFH